MFPGTERCANVNGPPIRSSALGSNPSKPLNLDRIRCNARAKRRTMGRELECLPRFREVGSCEGFG
jgi:hypothetical protein